MDDSINACVKYWLGYIFPKTCKEEKVVANKNVFFNLDLFFFNHTYGHFFSDVGSIRACAGHQPSFNISSGQFALVNSEDALYCGNKFLANPKVVVVVFVSEMKKRREMRKCTYILCTSTILIRT